MVPMTVVSGTLIKGVVHPLTPLSICVDFFLITVYFLGGLSFFLFLKENKDWNELIQDAQKRGAIIKTSEKSYRKDAVKILKLNATVQPSTKAGTKKSALLQACPSSSKRGELANPREAHSSRELAAGAGRAVPQGSRGPQQPQRAQAADSRRGSASAPVEAAALPADQEKPRDPRLASMASRTETKGKDQASKDSSRSAQSNAGSTSQQGLDVSSAARGQIFRTETPKKPQQPMGQYGMPSTSPYAARHESDQGAPVSKSSSKAHSEGGQNNSSKWNKEYQVLTRRTSEESPENTESNSAKRRKTSH